MQITADRPEGPVGDAHLPAIFLGFTVAGLFDAVHSRVEDDPSPLGDDLQGNDEIVDVPLLQRLVEILSHGEDRTVGADARGDRALGLFGHHLQSGVEADRFSGAAGFAVFCPAGDESYVGVGKGRGHFFQEISRKHGVGVGEQDDVAPGVGHAQVEAGGFALPFGKGREVYPRIAEGPDDGIGAIRRTVGDDEYLEQFFGVVELEGVGDLLPDHLLFIVDGDDNGEARLPRPGPQASPGRLRPGENDHGKEQVGVEAQQQQDEKDCLKHTNEPLSYSGCARPGK